MRLFFVLLMLVPLTAWAGMGAIVDGAGDPGDATEQANASDETLWRYAEQFRHQGHWRAADDLYAEFLRRQPDDEQAQFGKVWVEYYIAQTVQQSTEGMLLAAAKWEELAGRAKDATVAVESAYEAGSVYCSLREYEDCAERCLRALATIPADHHGHYRVLGMRALALIQQGKEAEALPISEEFEAKGNKTDAWVEKSRMGRAIRKADVLLAEKKYVEAAAECADALNDFPEADWAPEVKYRQIKATVSEFSKDGINTSEKATVDLLADEFVNQYPNHPWVDMVRDMKPTLSLDPLEEGEVIIHR